MARSVMLLRSYACRAAHRAPRGKIDAGAEHRRRLALRWLWRVGDRPRWRRDNDGRSSCGRSKAPDARTHVDPDLDFLPELAEDRNHSINSEAFKPHVADAGKFRRGNACR